MNPQAQTIPQIKPVPVKETELPSSFVHHCLYGSTYDPNKPPLVNAEHFEANYFGRFLKAGECFFFCIDKEAGTIHALPDERLERTKSDSRYVIPISEASLA